MEAISMGGTKPLTVYNMISFSGKDGEYKPLENCTPDELSMFRKAAGENIGKSLSDHFSSDPYELARLIRRYRSSDSQESAD